MDRLAPVLLLIVASASTACASAAPPPPVLIAPAPIAPAPIAPEPAIAPAPTTMPALPIDLPTAAEWTGASVAFVVDLALDGTTIVNGDKLASEEELLVKARLALRAHPDQSAVIRADQRASYGRVIHALDLLKQAGIRKIAFGVEAIAAPPPGPPPAGGAKATMKPDTSWDCEFPPEADAKRIDAATVVLEVDVAVDGSATGARVLSDPGYGFGAVAQRCVLGQRYIPATDASGSPIRSTTPPIKVRFTR